MNLNFTDKEQIFEAKYIGNFATPKKLNRSAKVIPAHYIDQIEDGRVTSPMLNEIGGIVPVFTYKTCITIHGNLPEISISRIGGYKNVIQNKNGSLEIRYSAIDHEQKKTIADMLHGTEWKSQENSHNGISFLKSKIADNKEDALKLLEEMKKEVAEFNCEGMKAKVYASGMVIWGRYYIYMGISPLIITGKPEDIAGYMVKKDSRELWDQWNERNEKRKAEREDRDKKILADNEQKELAKQAALEKIAHLKPFPVCPQIGKTYVSVIRLVKPGIEYGYRFYKVTNKGSFGRVQLETAITSTPTLDKANFQPYLKGKQVKPSDITGTYLFQ